MIIYLLAFLGIFLIIQVAAIEGRNQLIWAGLTFIFNYWMITQIHIGIRILDLFINILGGFSISYILMFILNIFEGQTPLSILRNFKKTIDLYRVKKLSDPFKLAKFAENNINWEVRKKAIENIDFQDVLIEISKNDSSSEVRRQAVKNINDTNVLIDIINTENDRGVRETALAKLKKLDPDNEEYLELREKHFWDEL